MSGECIIDGMVDVRGFEKLIKEHNDLIRHQNTILSEILDEMVLRRKQQWHK